MKISLKPPLFLPIMIRASKALPENGGCKVFRKPEKGSMFMIPKDPLMLLSFINMKLRDFYKDLDELCSQLELNRKELEEKLAGIEYYYDREANQFI